jgi:SAM-dependent methyltransferase
MSKQVDPQWYRKVWTLDIADMSWVEHTSMEVDFLLQELSLQGTERILDLACGFGRHSLELARRGFDVVGVDITQAYIHEAIRRAEAESLRVNYVQKDIRDVDYEEHFDVVLNMADGAIGYLENDKENLKIFDVVSRALIPGGKHFMGLCNAAYARRFFPNRSWQAGSRSLSLADFDWDKKTKRMVYTAHILRFGQVLEKPDPAKPATSYRLYTIEELGEILRKRYMHIVKTYGAFNRTTAASADLMTLFVYSEKE